MGRKPSGNRKQDQYGDLDFERGRDMRKWARRKGYEVREGSGSHFDVIDANGNRFTGYNGRMSKGVRCAIMAAILAAGAAIFAGFANLDLGAVVEIVRFLATA